MVVNLLVVNAVAGSGNFTIWANGVAADGQQHGLGRLDGQVLVAGDHGARRHGKMSGAGQRHL